MGNFIFVSASNVLRKNRYCISVFVVGLFLCLFAFTSQPVLAQVSTFAGNAQHTSIYAAPAQNLNTIKWRWC
jgi:hypothetical protein